MKYEMNLKESLDGYSTKDSVEILGDTYVETVSLNIATIISSGGKYQFRYGTEIDINNPDYKILKENIKKA